MRRRIREHPGDTPPPELFEFRPGRWPGATFIAQYEAYADARDAWEAQHPDDELPPPSDGPFDPSQI